MDSESEIELLGAISCQGLEPYMFVHQPLPTVKKATGRAEGPDLYSRVHLAVISGQSKSRPLFMDRWGHAGDRGPGG